APAPAPAQPAPRGSSEGAYDGARPAAAPVPAPAPVAAPTASPLPPAPAGAEAPTTQPLPPLQIGGGAAITLDLVRDAASNTTRLNNATVAASKVSLARGERRYAFAQPINLKLVADVVTANVPSTNPATTQPTQQVQQLKITQLGGDLGGLANLAMPSPITVSNLTGASPDANGKIALTGALAPLAQLLSVIQYADPMPYQGDYAVTQNVGTKSNAIQLAGDATVTKFVVLGTDGKAAFTEEKITLANDLVADTTAKTATINNVALDMASSKAAGVQLKGVVQDWEIGRKLNGVAMNLSYDLEKLWPMIKPMLAPETQESLKDLKVAGQFQRTFNVGGSYPAAGADGQPLAFNQAIKFLTMDGALAVGLLNTSGIDVQKLEVPLTLADGKLTTLYSNRPRAERAAKPASFNGGTLDLNSLLVDLAPADGPRLFVGKNQKLVAGASINELLGTTLGKYVNPVFTNSKRAKGLLDVTIAECDNLALGEAIKTAQSGRARIVFSLSDMDIANPVGELMLGSIINSTAQLFNAGGAKGQSEVFQGYIKDAVITIAEGRTTQDITFQLVDPGAPSDAVGAQRPVQSVHMPMSFRGNIALADLRQQLNVTIPAPLVSRFIPDRDIRKQFNDIFPSGIPIAMGGTTPEPKVQVGNIASQITQGLVKSRLTNVLGGNNAAGDGGAGGGGKPGDILGNILGGGRQQQEQQQEPDRPRQRQREQPPAQQQQPSRQRQRTAPASQPAPPARPADPVGGLLNDVLGGNRNQRQQQPREQDPPATPAKKKAK
ncbi:MAG TPA: hypothetical protein VER17_11200, partial [Tepidisphaeraceae bacterium]|nr:hypothetical protein [Tepidisphaeraceae bacterium]